MSIKSAVELFGGNVAGTNNVKEEAKVESKESAKVENVNEKKLYKVTYTGIDKSDLANPGKVGYTKAYSADQAILQISKKTGMKLRDVEVFVHNKDKVKPTVGKVMSLLLENKKDKDVIRYADMIKKMKYKGAVKIEDLLSGKYNDVEIECKKASEFLEQRSDIKEFKFERTIKDIRYSINLKIAGDYAYGKIDRVGVKRSVTFRWKMGKYDKPQVFLNSKTVSGKMRTKIQEFVFEIVRAAAFNQTNQGEAK